MIEGRGSSKQRMIFSLTSSAILIVSILLASISIQVPYASASSVDHNIGKLDINTLTDYGRILAPITWASIQTTDDPSTGSGFIGLVIDQDNYNHALGSEDIADSFSNHPYFGGDDFTMVSPINMIINDGVMQKSIASFQNTGTGTGDPNDTLINQTAWTVVNKDWAILQWTLNNLKNAPLNNVCIGLELPLSQVGARHGLGGDSGDDVDGFDAGDNIYWAQDDGGTGTCIGFGSAIVSDPITHYYSEDYHPASYDDYKVFWENDTWLYNRLHSTNAVVGASPGNRTSTVGWNDITIDTGSSRTLTLVIAINDTFDNMKKALKDAQLWYRNIAIGFRITEFSDDQLGTQQIEVYNIGPTTNLTLNNYFLSNDGGSTSLPGNWIPNDTIPTCGYRVFQVTGILIGPEGDTLGLYQYLGGGNIYLIDRVSYGQEGVAPDPLDGESVARRFDASRSTYMNEWLRNASTGPTWGAENDVRKVISSPWTVLNRVMFNPMGPAEGYVELKYKGGGTLNVSGYRIVCDEVFIIPSGIALNFSNKFYVLTQSNYPLNFDLDDGSVNGDNVYLYDSNGNLLDMVGWRSSHNQGEFMSRIPDGRGTHQGYDDVSSQCAGWAFDQLPNLVITEFFANSISARIEVFNPRGGDKCLDSLPPVWTFGVDNGALTGSWFSPRIPNKGYSTFIMTGGAPGEEGDTINLYYSGKIADRVSFGIKGVAPDPIFGESTSRYWEDSVVGYTSYWARNASTGPTWGSQNDVPPDNHLSSIILNEVLFNPNAVDDHYVEIYNRDATAMNISGYKLVCDTEYIIPYGTVLDFDDRFFYLDYDTDKAFFDNMSSSGDNIYLYNANGSLVDMVGWNSPHTIGGSVCRVPDGNGTRYGYDDFSSIAAGWRFDQIPSISLIQIGPDIGRYGHRGWFVSYILTIVSKHGFDDVVDISNVTGSWGWEITILDENSDPLNDSNGNGLPDIFVPAGGQINITVIVNIPPNATMDDNETTIITARSTFNFFFVDSATLRTKVSMGPLGTITFPIGSFVIPMDDKQIDILKAFGFVHALLRNGSTIYRIIEPPDATINTTRIPGAAVYCGGPILVMPSDSPIVNLVHQHFPAVTLDITISEFASNHVDVIFKPTNILVIYGQWGNTQDVLADMDIPFTMVDRTYVENDPNMLFNYDLIVDDCPGWSGNVPSTVANNMQMIAEQGGEVIFTDIALRDLDAVFPGYIPVTSNVNGTWPCLVYRIPEFPAQYYGPTTLGIYTMGGGQIMMAPTDPNVRIMVDCDNYGNDGYRVLAAYFYYGSSDGGPGVVEGFAYHPSGDRYQPPNARMLASVFFGNKFVHLPAPPDIINFYPPELYIKAVGDDIILNWTQRDLRGVSHYLIYRSTSQTGFDFSDIWVNTSLHDDNGTIPLRTTWNDTGAASDTAPQEYYYVIRTVYETGEISPTSRTVGKWTKTFPQGISTFSLPLEPLQTMNKSVDYYLNDMNAKYIKWIHLVSHRWMKHGDGGVNDTQMKVGEGYEVKFYSQSTYTFTGMPGAMIIYDDNIQFLGFDSDSEARNLTVFVEQNGDVNLTWQEPANMDVGDWYEAYYSNKRDGFFGTIGFDFFPACSPIDFGTNKATHLNAQANSPGARLYYMVVPVNTSFGRGASTYSIGIWTEVYLSQYDTIGIPLKLNINQTADWYCDNIPDTVGINYYNISAQRWSWHSKRMPSEAYDPLLVMTEGYQISTSNATKFTFIGI